MAYFNHAFRKTMVMSRYLDGTTEPAVANTLALESGDLALFNAQTFAPLDLDTPECCSFMVVSGSPYQNDRIGPFHGGYQESIKSKGINPRYISRVWDGLAQEAQPYVLNIGTTLNTVGNDGCCPEFLCGENYHLRVDVKGSPALRMLNHQGYVEVTAYGGCCPDQPDDPLIAPVPVDPATIMIQWAEGIWESVVVTGNGPNFSNQGPASAAARVNPQPLLVPVVTFVDASAGTTTLMYPPGWLALQGIDPTDIVNGIPAVDAVIDWNDYVSGGYGTGDCAGITLVGAFEDTRFGDCTFQTSDWYGLEPVRIFASEVDLNGAPCEFTGICIDIECDGRQAQGVGESALRDFILSESYRQNHFATDLRIREITQGTDMLGAGPGQIDRTALYDRLMIMHTVPRFNNPSGTFDNDQYIVEILTNADPVSGGPAARKLLLQDLDTITQNCGNPCIRPEDENALACEGPSVPVFAGQVPAAP